VTRRKLEAYEPLFQNIMIPFDVMNVPCVRLVVNVGAQSPQALNDAF
jgi:hypothetical protein